MDDQQNSIDIPDRMQTRLPFYHPVFTYEQERIAEDLSRLLKADPVLQDIGPIFDDIPFEPHCHPFPF